MWARARARRRWVTEVRRSDRKNPSWVSVTGSEKNWAGTPSVLVIRSSASMPGRVTPVSNWLTAAGVTPSRVASSDWLHSLSSRARRSRSGSNAGVSTLSSFQLPMGSRRSLIVLDHDSRISYRHVTKLPLLLSSLTNLMQKNKVNPDVLLIRRETRGACRSSVT